MAENPYAGDLAGREPIAALGESASTIRELASRFDESAWNRSYGPGKWTSREILVHLAQIEMVFGMRVRYALSTGNYVVQVFDQDPFMAVEAPAIDGPTALAAFLGLRGMNLQLFRSLTAEQLGTTFVHPERGEITVAWLVEFLAGHDWRHIGQLKTIAA